MCKADPFCEIALVRDDDEHEDGGVNEDDGAKALHDDAMNAVRTVALVIDFMVVVGTMMMCK